MSRLRFTPWVASGLLMGACAAAPVAPPTDERPSPPPPTPVATTAAAGGSSAPPVPSPSPGRTLTGRVRGLDGTPLAGAKVAIRSLDTTVPFAAETRTDATGQWQVPRPPAAGTTVEVVAGGENLTSRRRVATLGAGSTTVDFGEEGPGAAFFLSDRPEITRTEPVPDATLKASFGLRYTLSLSRPLSAESRVRLAAALRLAPASEAAAGGRGVTDLTARTRRHPDALMALGLGPYALKPGDRLARTSDIRLRTAWEPDGLTLVLSFEGALQTGLQRARYQVLLESDGRPLVDEAGTPLGTGPTGLLGSHAAAGEVILGAFAAPDPELSAVSGLAPGSPDARWAGTHDAARAFFVPADKAPPTLQALEVEERSGNTRLRLAFDEPLLAADGSDAGVRGKGTGASGADLAGLVFLLGDRNSLRTTRLQDDGANDAVVVDPRVTTRYGIESERDVPFRFDPGAFVAAGAGAPAGSVQLEIDPAEPTVLVVTLVGRKDFFDPEAEALAARCEGVGDPSGNRRPEDLADRNLVTTPL